MLSSVLNSERAVQVNIAVMLAEAVQLAREAFLGHSDEFVLEPKSM